VWEGHGCLHFSFRGASGSDEVVSQHLLDADMYLSSERAAEPSLSHLRRSIEQAYEDGQKARAENESLVRSPERETPKDTAVR
jgi:hypothetical protein